MVTHFSKRSDAFAANPGLPGKIIKIKIIIRQFIRRHNMLESLQGHLGHSGAAVATLSGKLGLTISPFDCSCPHILFVTILRQEKGLR